jgi:hypothetical protein
VPPRFVAHISRPSENTALYPKFTAKIQDLIYIFLANTVSAFIVQGSLKVSAV